ncbi:MAG: hypothetical protein ACR2IJ_09065 [Fluviibacter sp.]
MKKPSIQAQIDAVELIIANRKGFIETLQGLVKARKREPIELEIAESPMPALEAALRTLKWVNNNKELIKKAVAGKEET